MTARKFLGLAVVASAEARSLRGKSTGMTDFDQFAKRERAEQPKAIIAPRQISNSTHGAPGLLLDDKMSGDTEKIAKLKKIEEVLVKVKKHTSMLMFLGSGNYPPTKEEKRRQQEYGYMPKSAQLQFARTKVNAAVQASDSYALSPRKLKSKFGVHESPNGKRHPVTAIGDCGERSKCVEDLCKRRSFISEGFKATQCWLFNNHQYDHVFTVVYPASAQGSIDSLHMDKPQKNKVQQWFLDNQDTIKAGQVPDSSPFPENTYIVDAWLRELPDAVGDKTCHFTHFDQYGTMVDVGTSKGLMAYLAHPAMPWNNPDPSRICPISDLNEDQFQALCNEFAPPAGPPPPPSKAGSSGSPPPPPPPAPPLPKARALSKAITK